MKKRLKKFYDKYLFFFPDFLQYGIIIVLFGLLWLLNHYFHFFGKK